MASGRGSSGSAYDGSTSETWVESSVAPSEPSRAWPTDRNFWTQCATTLDSDYTRKVPLNIYAPPAGAPAQLCQNLALVARGVGFVPGEPPGSTPDGTAAKLADDISEIWFSGGVGPFGNSRLAGQTPPLEFMRNMQGFAMDNSGSEAGGAQWDGSFVRCVLRHTIRPEVYVPVAPGGVDFGTLRSSVIDPRFQGYCPLQTVDYGLLIQLPSDEAYKAVSHSLFVRLDYDSINFTEDRDIRSSAVIAIPIVTKRTCGDIAGSEVQLAVWQAASYNFLSEAISRQKKATDPSLKEEDVKKFVNEAFQKLGCLPGIITDGSTWGLTLTTSNHAGKLVFHSRHIFGQGCNLLGMYQLVVGIRLIAGWVQEHFWPWFKQYVLWLPAETDLDE